VTTRWLARANGVSVWTIRRWRRLHPESPPTLNPTRELGLAMALARPPAGLLPLWSRMAIADYAHHGASYREIAAMFRCSKNTVWRCVRRRPTAFEPLSGRRALTGQQHALALSNAQALN